MKVLINLTGKLYYITGIFQVSISKKKKNRMHKDTAAIIAMTKSRSQLSGWFNPDTDNLVNNEAEVVYDERTNL